MNKVLRILVIRNAYQKDAGGAEQYALNLCVALKRSGHMPLLVTNIEKIHQKAKAENIKVVRGPWHKTQKWDRFYYLRYPLFTLWYVYRIVRHRIDIVHPQGRDDFIFATRAARLLRRRVIWTDHADLKYALDNVNHYNPRIRSWLIKASKKAAVVIAASQNELNEIKAVAPEIQNLVLVHNGVFVPSNVSPAEKTNKLVVGTNSRLVPAKGISELLEGFAALGRKDVDLWLLGGASGNLNKYKQQVKKLSIDQRVKFIDYVSNPNDYVASMDIFVHSSYHEAFSLAIIEAAMLARPIVATNVGGTPEIIDNSCGILIEPKKPGDITAALSRLINDAGLRSRLGEVASKKARANFDFQKIVDEKILKIYRGSND